MFTKVLTQRIRHLLGNLVQKYQHAQPGGQTSASTTLLRDLYWARPATNNKWEEYFISFHFQKAFGSIDHQWLYKVLNVIKFLFSFIKIIVDLNANAFSSITVNDFITSHLNLARGVRQGDLLSLFLFLLTVEPLVSYINGSPAIQGIKVGNTKIKYAGYANDMTLTLIDNTQFKKHMTT